MEQILNKLKKRVLVYDGAMGTMLQERGLKPGQVPEEWNLLRPEEIVRVHQAYFKAGADIVETNTFGGNPLTLKKSGLAGKCAAINSQAVKLARQAAGGKGYVAASVGPLPEMVSPLGNLGFTDTLNIFKEQIKALASAKPDLILFETFSDIKELKIAVIAAREVCKIPIQAQLTYALGGRTISGTPPEVAAVVLEGLGVEIIGANCSLGPEELLPIMKQLARVVSPKTFLSLLPNAGLPEMIDGATCYQLSPKQLAAYSRKFQQIGINLIGGCCGTTPAHIKEIAKTVKNKKTIRRKARKKYLTLASRTRVLELDPSGRPFLIGERINPTRRKALQEEFRSGSSALLREEALKQVHNGAHLLDVNVGMPGINEPEVMRRVLAVVEQTTDVPLVIDSNSAQTLTAGLQECAGKPLVNSVNGENKKTRLLLPLVKKYGAALIALTIDDKGIPKTAGGRLEVARKIMREAGRLGIKREDVIVDLLTLAVGAEPKSAEITLEALRQAERLGWQTSLGVSNISFGLPNRAAVNSTFLVMALRAGLTAAIVNPLDPKLQETVLAWAALTAKGFVLPQMKTDIKIPRVFEHENKQRLYECILSGDKDNVVGFLNRCLQAGEQGLKINQQILIPALEEVGRRYEKKEYFLPQLLLAAEAMQKAVAILEKTLSPEEREGRARILLATVKGDLHDIGKNIVAAVLRNYGYQVIDLGKDVSAGRIVAAAKEKQADIIGLSSLMTTTMGQMEVVLKELRKRSLKIPVLIGGAVVSESYAKRIGAIYAKDAVTTVAAVKKTLTKV